MRTLSAALAFCLAVPSVASANPDFDEWLAELRSEALERGISPATVGALSELEPDPKVLALDRSQPGETDDFCNYLDRQLTPRRIARARARLKRHSKLLASLEASYGVPPRYLVSLWGLESGFGNDQGNFEVIRSLATLAHDPRRPSLFREQLFGALRILDREQLLPSQLRGSWAGAMGQVQFMPTTFLDHAVDYDGDGRKDIWNSVPDALASAANYLVHAGWRNGQSWGRPVRLPNGFRKESASSSEASLSEWRSRGVRRHDGSPLPRAKMSGRIVLPSPGTSPAFLVYPNYETILRWNRSHYFGLSVGTLADHITRRSAPICAG